MTKVVSLAALVGVALVPLAANAHHSYSEYDDAKSVEVEGKLVEVAWQNPHARILVESVDAAGARVTWDIESAGLNNFRRMNVPLEIFAVGSTVKIAGWPSKRSNTRMYGTNLLADDGRELVMWRYSKPLWSAKALGYGSDFSLFETGTASAIRDGVSHVGLRSRRPGCQPGFAVRGVDLAAHGEGASGCGAFNPVTDTTTRVHAERHAGDHPPAVPDRVRGPRRHDRAQDGGVRHAPHDPHAHRAGRGGAEDAARLLGGQVGRQHARRRDDAAQRAVPRQRRCADGAGCKLVERFAPSADGSRLNYTLVITDPDSLTAPIEGKRSWVWRPDEKVMPFNCTANAQ